MKRGYILKKKRKINFKKFYSFIKTWKKTGLDIILENCRKNRCSDSDHGLACYEVLKDYSINKTLINKLEYCPKYLGLDWDGLCNKISHENYNKMSYKEQENHCNSCKNKALRTIFNVRRQK